MGVRVKGTRHGTLAFRVRWHGADAFIGTKLADDGARGRNRRIAESKATLLEEDLRRGVPLHQACLERLGSCPARFLPQTAHDDPCGLTVRAYYGVWITRQMPPMVKASRAAKYREYFAGVILPAVGNVPLSKLTTQVLKDFQAKLFQRTIRGRPIRVKTVRNIIDGHLRALYRDAREEREDKALILGLHRERWSRSPAPMPRRDCGCEEAGAVAPQRREEEDGDGDHASVDRETDRAPLRGESGNPTGNFCLRAAERNDKQADSDEKRKWSHGESNICHEDPPETEQSPASSLESRASDDSDDDQRDGKKRQE